ncbi:P-loop containing nucleoside triphosphate hydrolase protein [Trametes maxima]|nr:P-loop containing nucleoside triphosphate hydrolase protein [Trametes maxima]
MEALIDLVCKELASPPRLLREVVHLGAEKFTTGDTNLDEVLSGGIRIGMVWELAGENNAGKTQLALQLSLTVQLPKNMGGISGAACYVSTRGDLPTPRIGEIVECHPLLSSELCRLSDIHTVKAPYFPALQKVLTESVPAFAEQRASTPGAKPAKLLIIDTLSDVFDKMKDDRYEDTILRARHLRLTSSHLHSLASKYQLAVVVLCGARSTFPRTDGGDRAPGELRYSNQERWFARGHTLPGEDAHEAVLGHVWPNQLNARIMMSRTIRTRSRAQVAPQVPEGPPAKRRKLEDGKECAPGMSAADEVVPFRRFTVIFSSAGPPDTCDYVVLDEGVRGFAAEEAPPLTFIYPMSPSSGSVPSEPQAPTQDSSSNLHSGDQGTQNRSLQFKQSLSYASNAPPQATPPSQSTLTAATTTTESTAASAFVSASSVVDDSQPRYLQSLSYASNPTTVPPSQSVVPSSQPDQEEDWDMYWKDTQDDDHLYASVDEHLQGAGEGEAAAEEGPPVEKDSDSDYYWDEGNDGDALCVDM